MNNLARLQASGNAQAGTLLGLRNRLQTVDIRNQVKEAGNLETMRINISNIVTRVKGKVVSVIANWLLSHADLIERFTVKLEFFP
jgi:hypothetical protein